MILTTFNKNDCLYSDEDLKEEFIGWIWYQKIIPYSYLLSYVKSTCYSINVNVMLIN